MRTNNNVLSWWYVFACSDKTLWKTIGKKEISISIKLTVHNTPIYYARLTAVVYKLYLECRFITKFMRKGTLRNILNTRQSNKNSDVQR